MHSANVAGDGVCEALVAASEWRNVEKIVAALRSVITVGHVDTG